MLGMRLRVRARNFNYMYIMLPHQTLVANISPIEGLQNRRIRMVVE